MKNLQIEELALDSATQARADICAHTVEDYRRQIGDNGGEWPFDEPLDVFTDGKTYYLADGFHRTLAAASEGVAVVPCRIHNGGAQDARVFGMTANDGHGLRPNRADRRLSVKWLLDHRPEMTQEEIAAKAGCSRRLVQLIVSERREFQAQRRKEPDGRGVTEDSWTEPDQDSGPRPPRNGMEESGAPFEADPFLMQRTRTVKTVEALIRAFDDLNGFRRALVHQDALDLCGVLLQTAKEWGE